MKRTKSVEEYIENAEDHREELTTLRAILKKSGLEETVKWGAPVYMHRGKNVVGLGSFKSSVGLWFFQGALLQDRDEVLVNARDGTTKALRQWRFGSKKEIRPAGIRKYVKEATALVEAGKEMKADRNKALSIPFELKKALKSSSKARSAFEGLTPGKKREYAEYIASAKKDETKVKRLEKILPMIEAGVGLHDKYRNC